MQHIDSLLVGDSLNRSLSVGGLLREACFRLHCTNVENENLSNRLTAARAQEDEKELEVQRLTRRIGSLEAHLEAFTAVHIEGVAPATGEFRAYSLPCGVHDGRSG